MKKNLLSSRNFLIWTLLPLVVFTLQNVAHAQIFQDSTFTNSAWNSVLLPNSVAQSSCTASQDTANGNPAPSRLTTHTYPLGQIFCAHLSVQSTYDPATQGEIVRLSYSYDLAHYTNLQVAYSPLIFQNNTYYWRVPNDLISGGIGWMSFSGPLRSNLTAASFTKLVGPSPNANPDFSCRGSRIVFGYLTRNSNPTAGTTDITRSGIDNWKVSIDERRPCCVTISDARVTCDRGVFTYTFMVTNTSTQTIQYLLLSPPAGATFTISPNVINLGANPLGAGQSTTVSVTIGHASPGDHICLNVALADRNVVSCCTIQACVDLPDCCLRLFNTSIVCGANGSYAYTFTLQNLTGITINQIFMVPTLPSNLNISPQMVTLSTPLLPGNQTTLTITITGAPPGTNVSLWFTPLGDNGESCCSVERRFTLPDCHP